MSRQHVSDHNDHPLHSSQQQESPLTEDFSTINDRLKQEIFEHKQTVETLNRERNLLRTIIENSSDHIYVKDLQGCFLIANDVVAETLGADTPRELLGKTDFDFHPRELAERYYADEQMLFRDDQPLINHEEPILDHKSGETHWLLTTKIPYHDHQGQVIGLVGFNRDITRRKQAQIELEATNRELEKRRTELAQANEDFRLLNARLQEENLRMQTELDVARRLQEIVLPPVQELQQLLDVDVVGCMNVADEVGGDYYDVLQQQDGLYLGIGDVTGHGLESGVLMFMLQTSLRALIEQGETELPAVVMSLNRTLFKNLQRMKVGRTVTFSLSRYQHGRMTFIGQHEEILVLRHAGWSEIIDTCRLGFPLGLEEDISKWIATTSIELAPGDGIALYTDGITEAQNSQGQFYGRERLYQFLNTHWRQCSLEEIKALLISDIQSYVGDARQHDDYTFVLLRRKTP